MDIRLLFIAFCLSVSTAFSQTDVEMGSVYINRAEQSYLDNDLNEAISNFDKAMRYIKEVKDSKVARIGTLISFKLNDLSKADVLAKRYFDLNPEKDTEEFKEMLELRVTIMEALEARAIAEKKALEAKIAKEKEARRIDSLTTIWNNKAKEFLIAADSVGDFNSYNIAIYKVADKLGLISEVGDVILEANTYSHVLFFDGFYIFMNDDLKPTRLYCFNAQLKEGYNLPNVSEFNAEAYDYGKVMLPRENGILITYPSNSNDIAVFDLNTRRFMYDENKKDLLKDLKKNDIIERYNSDLQIRLNKEWYDLGTTIGGGFYPVFNGKSLKGFLSTSNGRLFDTEYYQYFGPFCNGRFQIVENGNSLWMDAEGIKFDTIDDNTGQYTGHYKFVKENTNHYRIVTKEGEKEVFVKGEKRFPKLDDFLEQHPK